jgi:hypothetical protein
VIYRRVDSPLGLRGHRVGSIERSEEQRGTSDGAAGVGMEMRKFPVGTKVTASTVHCFDFGAQDVSRLVYV